MNTGTLELRHKAFQLPSFLAHNAPLADHAAKGGWSHTHYLDELTAMEARERDNTMATLDTRRFPTPVHTQIARLVEGQFLQETTNLCVFGNPGTGRSHVVSALVERLLEAKRDLRASRELRQLDRIECLILDDIGYVQHDRGEMEVRLALFDERYERRSVAISSTWCSRSETKSSRIGWPLPLRSTGSSTTW